MFEQKSCIAPKMFEQKTSWKLWTKVLLCTKNVWKKSCCPLNMFAQKFFIALKIHVWTTVLLPKIIAQMLPPALQAGIIWRVTHGYIENYIQNPNNWHLHLSTYRQSPKNIHDMRNLSIYLWVNPLTDEASRRKNLAFAPQMFEQKSCFTPRIFRQKSCISPKMFQQKSCFVSKMFEQKSSFASKIFKLKSCFAPNKSLALHPKCLNKSLVLHPKYLNKVLLHTGPKCLNKSLALHSK